MTNTLTLEEQISTLQKLGFRFLNSTVDHPAITTYEWWEYLDPPYVLLMQRIICATDFEPDICEGAFALDLKHLRFEGWYEKVGQKLSLIHI